MNYPYKAFFHNLLSHGYHVKEDQLLAKILWSKDTAGKMDDTSPVTGSNTGLTKRFVRLQKSIVCDLEGPLLSDVFQVNELLLNGVNLKVKLWPSTNAFRLMSATANAYKIVFTAVELKMIYVTLSPALITSHAEILNDRNAHYAFIRNEIKTISIPSGQRSVNIEDFFLGEVADKVVIGFVSATAYSGDESKNPYNFKHYKLSYLDLQVNGVSVKGCPKFPKIKFTTDISSTINECNVVPSYLTLFDSKGSDLDIDLEDYVNGYFLHVFDTTATDPCSDTNNKTMQQKGNMKLSLQFEEDLSETVMLIVRGSFPSYFEVDSSRNVFPP